jgi:hypothetical protein
MAVASDNLPLIVCDQCGDVMKLIRTVPEHGALPELHVFVCPSCGDVQTKGGRRRA